MAPGGPDSFGPSASIDALKRCSALRQLARSFFVSRGYWEVDTPTLSRDTVVDAHLDPIEAQVMGRRMFLQTSPEFHMKRLLAAGAGSIFQFSRAYRQGELGNHHQPEFTMLEWYKVGAGASELRAEIAQLVTELLGTPPANTISYREAFRRHATIDPFEATDHELRSMCEAISGGAAPIDRDDLLNMILQDRVEPNLGVGAPAFLVDYPATQAALARAKIDAPHVAERFELYIDGVELCNGYHELCDPEELRRRSGAENDRRRALGKDRLPTESQLIRAMEHGLPDCSGVALGWDRLCQLRERTETLGGVIAFPFDRA